jgi:hypothetical protein
MKRKKRIEGLQLGMVESCHVCDEAGDESGCGRANGGRSRAEGSMISRLWASA